MGNGILPTFLYNFATNWGNKNIVIYNFKKAIPAHENMIFNITFHPNVVNNDISFSKVKCNVEGAEPLFLNLFGKCVP